MRSPAKFQTETELCAAFQETLPKDWTAYNETAGFDMVLVHDTGFQIGVEAKQTLNAKVLTQAAETSARYATTGPDCRAVLVGRVSPEFKKLADLLGITVLTVTRKDGQVSSYGTNSRTGCKWFSAPKLPRASQMKTTGCYDRWQDDHWHDHFPEARLELPEYVPDVPAGVKSPVVLSGWKVQAIKICVLLERRGYVERSDFRKLKIDPGRWMNGVWLEMGASRGQWVKGASFPGDRFRGEHPEVFPKIDADFEKWAKEADVDAGQMGRLV